MSTISRAFLLLLLSSVTAHAGTFHVSTQGSDSSPCGAGPRRTIAGGIACLSSGDTLLVGSGTYAEQINDTESGARPPSGHSWATATTLRAAPGATVWLAPTHDSGSGIGVIEFDRADSQYIVLDGLNIDAGQGASNIALGIQDSHHIRFQNMEVKNTRVTAIKINGSYNEFLNMDVHDNATHPAVAAVGGHGFYISGMYNLFDGIRRHDNHNGYGIQFTCEGCAGNVRHNVMQNAEIYNNGRGGVIAFPNNTVQNSRIHHNTNLGIKTYGDVIDNVFCANDGNDIEQVGSGQVRGNTIGGDCPQPPRAPGTPSLPPLVVLPAPRNLRVVTVP